jgi:hypothetical protein
MRIGVSDGTIATLMCDFVGFFMLRCEMSRLLFTAYLFTVVLALWFTADVLHCFGLSHWALCLRSILFGGVCLVLLVCGGSQALMRSECPSDCFFVFTELGKTCSRSPCLSSSPGGQITILSVSSVPDLTSGLPLETRLKESLFYSSSSSMSS